MSKSNRSPRWLFLGVALGLIFFFAPLGRRLTVSSGTPLTGCVFDPGTGGGLGLSRWAKRLGFTVRSLLVPIWEVSGYMEVDTGNCLLTMGNGAWAHTGDDIDDKKWRTLRHWLSQGNTLIIVTTRPESLPEPFRFELIGSLSGTGLDDKEVPSLWQNNVEAEPKTEILPTRDGDGLTVAADGPRWQICKKPTPIVPFCWAADDRGGKLFRIPFGKGAVYLLLDDFAWTNAGLDHGGNAKVLSKILTRELRGGVIGIDEYRHGHGQAKSFLTYLIHLPGSTAFLCISSFLFLLYFYGRNIRLRPAEAYPIVERRTAREYIDAVAQLQERARAASLVVEAVARRLRHLSQGPAPISPRANELLGQAERYVAEGDRPARPTLAMELAKAIIRVRKQLYGSRTLS